MENDNNKTICAISTPLGNGGISIVRMSGSKSKEILQRVASVNVENLEPKKLQLTTIKTEHFSEQAMVVWFKAPSSYTGEDMVEIQCHCGIVIAKGI
ncbi:MAG: tRNA uridine-5-carboxymethylaminomethyl(34) synthesis GTPase MnmE, partial [Clostridia bacterium]|nr:tRNA uridine-5-carboxymethylaminomethyl(34) synthesis GTPase MnmE [Clostridia bacterium]